MSILNQAMNELWRRSMCCHLSAEPLFTVIINHTYSKLWIKPQCPPACLLVTHHLSAQVEVWEGFKNASHRIRPLMGKPQTPILSAIFFAQEAIYLASLHCNMNKYYEIILSVFCPQNEWQTS